VFLKLGFVHDERDGVFLEIPLRYSTTAEVGEGALPPVIWSMGTNVLRYLSG